MKNYYAQMIFFSKMYLIVLFSSRKVFTDVIQNS